MNCLWFICELCFIIILLWWIDFWFNLLFWVFFVYGDFWFNLWFELLVNCVLSCLVICYNVIVGCWWIWFLNVLKIGFLVVLVMFYGYVINCVFVYCFWMGRMLEIGFILVEWCEFLCYVFVCIFMYVVKIEFVCFWWVFGWFVVCFIGFLLEMCWGFFRWCW